MGKVAVVTGAGSGIGRGFAQALLREGWSVALIGRRAQALQDTAAAMPARAMVLPADVAEADGVDHAFASVFERFGRLDLLFNNAGTFGGGAPFDEITDDGWLNSVAVNLNGAFFCARAAFRVMKLQDPQGGRIINNGSISAHVPRPAAGPYTATKHAISGLTKQVALDGRPYGIAASQIDIGNAETPLSAHFGAGMLQADGSRQPEPLMAMDHVTEALMYMARLPLSATVLNMTVMATTMPFVGRG